MKIAVIGGGPAGATLAMMLAGTGALLYELYWKIAKDFVSRI